MAGPTSPTLPAKRLSHSRIELVEVAGQGGMSTVWRGWLHGSRNFRRPVAIKHMAPHLAKQLMYREMFFEEARVGALLEDPNIPQVYEYLVQGNDHYIVMEYIEGINLASLIRYMQVRLGRPMPWELVAAVGIGVLRGLSAAHERLDEDGKSAPIVHRDVSPHNVMISAKGPAKLIDFGLSFARDRRCGDTAPGVAKGKLPYLSPDIAAGGRPSPASDQFAAGSVLWEALVGRRLFDDEDRAVSFKRLSEADVPPLRDLRKDLPEELASLVHRALSREIEDRFPSTREMAKQLGDVLKRSVSKEDLYATLARSVADARLDRKPEEAETISEIESSLVELVLEEEATAKAPASRKSKRSLTPPPATRSRA
jgi:eukaryotic-like serine/threonine-protein kinase